MQPQRPKFELWLTIYFIVAGIYGYYLIRQMIGD